MNSVHYKVYLPLAESEPEIRRIAVEKSNNSYQILRNKICSSFPSLKGFDFNLYWKDLEGDNIRISTDAELIIALNDNTHQHYKKIYITPLGQDFNKDTSKANKTCKVKMTNNSKNFQDKNGLEVIKEDKEPIHPTVTCDNCGQNPLYGFRYKCLVCYDYDLCAACEKSQNVHKEHPMLRIPIPASSGNPLGKIFFNVKVSMIQNLKCLLQD